MVAHVINLSHTLTQAQIDEITSRVTAMHGDAGDVVVKDVPVHIDMTKNIIAQLAELWNEKIEPILSGDVNVFVLPGLSIAAAFVAAIAAQTAVSPVYAAVMRRREGIVNIYDVVDLWRIV